MTRTRHDDATPDERARRRGAFWPWFVTALLVATAAAQGIMLYEATRDPTFSIEPDYYQKGVEWDSTMARERESVALGWRATTTMNRAATNAVILHVAIADSAGAPVDGASVRAVLVNNLDGDRHIAVTLADSGGGAYVIGLPHPRAGLWEIRLDARRGTSHFSPTLRTELHQ